jgi:hypothetical protein
MTQPMQGQAGQGIEGSTGLGFLAGFFGGFLGLILVFLIAKGPKTKRGAIYGIIGQVVLGVVFGVLVPLLFMGRAASVSPGVSTPAVEVPAMSAGH